MSQKMRPCQNETARRGGTIPGSDGAKTLGGSWRDRLRTYSVLLGAAAASAGAAETAKATEIWYSGPLNHKIQANHLLAFFFDQGKDPYYLSALSNPGTPAGLLLFFNHTIAYYDYQYVIAVVQGGAGLAVDNPSTVQYPGFTWYKGDPAKLHSDEPIETQPFRTHAVNSVNGTNGRFQGNLAELDYNGARGAWHNTSSGFGTGFLGFQTASGRFGWLHLALDGSNGNALQPVLIDWALHTVAGAAIKAGEGRATAAGAIPEPGAGSLALLAAGACGLAALRRRRQKREMTEDKTTAAA